MTHIKMQQPFKTVSIHTGAWFVDRRVDLFFPRDWQIKINEGALLQKLDEKEIIQKLEEPIGSNRIDHYLGKGKKVAIVIDDLTRPTNVQAVLNHLIGKAKDAGIPSAHISICIAYGTHILEPKSLMRHKLGDILDTNIDMVHHECQNQDDLDYVGRTRTGIPVWINNKYAQADVRIAISGVCPHDDVGYSGGGKILLGVCGLETISKLHNKFYRMDRGHSIDTQFRRELESLADVAGLDYSINLVTNHKRETAGVYCGDFRKAFRQGASFVQQHFGVQKPGDADIVISNAYPLDNFLSILGKSFWPFNFCKKSAYKIVVSSLCDQTDTRVPLTISHARLIKRKLRAMCQWHQFKRNVNLISDLVATQLNPAAKYQKRFVFYAPHVSSSGENTINSFEGKRVIYSWDQLVGELSALFYNKPTPSVCIYTHAPLQYPRIK